MKYVIAIFAWPLGSAIVIGLIRRFTTADWTYWFGGVFTVVWGGILFWLVLRPKVFLLLISPISTQ